MDLHYVKTGDREKAVIQYEGELRAAQNDCLRLSLCGEALRNPAESSPGLRNDLSELQLRLNLLPDVPYLRFHRGNDLNAVGRKNLLKERAGHGRIRPQQRDPGIAQLLRALTGCLHNTDHRERHALRNAVKHDMQKQYCREFTKRQPDWEIVKEFSEKGVSGFKISAKDRDAIQEIQKMALQGEFDILLVFMFDRLGRRDDETPFVVEWFVKQNIEV